MTANITHFKTIADTMITKYGKPAILRRSSGDRPCVATITSFSPMERVGALRNPLDRKALISAVGLDIPPDQEKDRLITFKGDPPVEDEVLKIVEPPGKISPTGDAIFYRLTVRR